MIRVGALPNEQLSNIFVAILTSRNEHGVPKLIHCVHVEAHFGDAGIILSTKALKVRRLHGGGVKPHVWAVAQEIRELFALAMARPTAKETWRRETGSPAGAKEQRSYLMSLSIEGSAAALSAGRAASGSFVSLPGSSNEGEPKPEEANEGPPASGDGWDEAYTVGSWARRRRTAFRIFFRCKPCSIPSVFFKS